jgi:hypothetical protein
MSDDLVCSDLCEEGGFPRQAELLRALAGERSTVYLVMERGAEYNDEIMNPQREGDPKSVFLDRHEAEQAALARNASWHRTNSILDYCYKLSDVTAHSEKELNRRISEILGRPYELPGEGHPTLGYFEESLVSGPVTDEQMKKISELFTLKFFYVVESHFSRPAPGLPFGEELPHTEGQR